MYQQIRFECECGKQPVRVREIGLTADRQLVVYWRCSRCRRQVYIVKSLADYWRECPSQNPRHDAAPRPQQGCQSAYHAGDVEFLRSVGIRVPEDLQADVT